MSVDARQAQTPGASLWLAGVFVVAALLMYLDTMLSMVSIWARSDTFAHGFLILPISLWLIWNRRHYLAAITPRPAPWVALLLLPVGFGWLVAHLVDVLVVQQLALVAMLIIGAWSILGHRLSWAIAFPLFFLFFAVPMGEGLIGPMMDFTAFSTVWLIQQSGIPVFREGLYFTLPTGRWSVVEACSGVRYIIASLTVGALFAYLTYQTWWRRGLFLLISAIVPVFANTLRAYIIVMLGHYSDMKVATGADHLVYGWVFFGIVIFILFWLGSFFREDEAPPESVSTAASVAVQNPANSRALLLAFVAALLMAAIAPLSTRWLSVSHSVDAAAVVMPQPVGGWRQAVESSADWRPLSRVNGGIHRQFARADDSVAMELQFADSASGEGEVIGSSRLFVEQDGPWKVVDRATVPISVAGDRVAVDEAIVRGPSGELVVWSWYVLGTLQTANDYVGKLYQAAATLGLVPPGVIRVVLYTPREDIVHEGDADGRARLRAFLQANGDMLAVSLRGAIHADP